MSLFNSGYDWKITLKKAAVHALYSASAIMLTTIADYILPNLNISANWLFIVPPTQAALKAAINWLKEH